MRWLRGIGALVVLAALLGGAPWALVAWGELGVLGTLNRNSLTGPTDPRLILGVLTLVGWASWGVFVASFLVECAARVCGRQLRLPVLGVAQGAAGALIAAVVGLAVATARPEVSGIDLASPVTAAVTTEIVSQGPVDEGDLRYTTRFGDELWDLAERFYGSGQQWSTIVRANHLDPAAQLPVGVTLRLPGALPAEVPTEIGEAAPSDLTASPQDGDDLDEALVATGALSAAVAGAVLVNLAARRRDQLTQRPLGRRLLPLSAEAGRMEHALSRLAASAPDPLNPSPVTVVVGAGDDDCNLTIDLAQHSALAVVGESSLTDGFLGGVVTSLACAEWSQGVRVVVGIPALAWVSAYDHPLLEVVEPSMAFADLHGDALARRHGDREAALECPAVYLLPHAPEQVPEAPGLSVVWASVTGDGVHLRDDSHAVWDGLAFAPQIIGEPLRRALVELHHAVASDETRPAPWWSDDPPPNMRQIHPTPDIHREEPAMGTTAEHPKLLLLGPVSLIGTKGTPPSRAPRQCEEYCGWLLENPGRTSNVMAQSLVVAETTRRSNMSRLRHWLGQDSTGEPYLPEAYTGRINLHPAVSSDWDDLQVLIAGGVNRATSQALVEALHLVRGEPLADVAPGQWRWAETWRLDMVSTIRDIAVVLAERCMEASAHDEARWAIDRGLAAAPGDEVLLTAKLTMEHALGNVHDAERLVMQITRDARQRGSDLRPETVSAIQMVVEGRVRNRRA